MAQIQFIPQIHRIDASHIHPDDVPMYVNAEATRFIKTITNANKNFQPRLTRIGDAVYEITYYSEVGYEIPAGIALRRASSATQTPSQTLTNLEQTASKIEKATQRNQVHKGVPATSA